MKGNLMKIKVLGVDWHRNGIFGRGFWLVQFVYDKRRFMATVFDKARFVAVVDIENPTNHMRGDEFEKPLRSSIEEYERKRNESETVV